MLRTMTYGMRQLRPVGDPIVTRESPFDANIFGERDITFYHSGTAALAASLLALKKLNANKTSHPEVLLPAYTCPDLISACIYSGITPVLIDVEESTCWMSIDIIRQAITSNTIGIIAVRFLGIAERMAQLRLICDEHGISLVEDSAQGFPVRDPSRYWQGDIVVLSFGRGKPVNLLGGGAVLTKKAEVLAHLPGAPRNSNCSRAQRISFYAKIKIYNALIKPLLYNAATKIPGLNIGDTIYKPLTSLNTFPACTKRYLTCNIQEYRDKHRIDAQIHSALGNTPGTELLDLPGRLSHDFSEPLLRYPILFRDKDLRDRLLLALSSYGASAMYGTPLNQVKNIPENSFRIPQPIQNAYHFSQQLLTLPTHTAMHKSTQEEVLGIIRKLCC